LLSGLIRKLLKVGGEAAPGAETSALIALDKLGKIGKDPVIQLLSDIPGADAGGARALLDLVTTKDRHGDTDLALVAAELAGDAPAKAEIDRVRQVLGTARTALEVRGGSGKGKI